MSTQWTPCTSNLPPDDVVVDTISEGGIQQHLKRSGRLWFVPDGTMYAYYTPTHWRFITPPTS